MNRNAVIGAIVGALLLGLLLGYFLSGQRGGDRSALEQELADVKSKLGMENQELRTRLAETEKKLEQETAARKNAEAALVKAKVWK